jgi:hypothetical protein
VTLHDETNGPTPPLREPTGVVSDVASAHHDLERRNLWEDPPELRAEPAVDPDVGTGARSHCEISPQDLRSILRSNQSGMMFSYPVSEKEGS